MGHTCPWELSPPNLESALVPLLPCAISEGKLFCGIKWMFNFEMSSELLGVTFDSSGFFLLCLCKSSVICW